MLKKFMKLLKKELNQNNIMKKISIEKALLTMKINKNDSKDYKAFKLWLAKHSKVKLTKN